MLPFTHAEFLAVFARYNAAVWPAQIAAYALGGGVLWAMMRRTRAAAMAAALMLAVLWLWTGVVYQALHFARINPAAYVFGAFFVLQGVLLTIAALRGELEFGQARGWRYPAGSGLILYALVAYPLIGVGAGAKYSELPMFGITPCPLTLFTVGALLLAAAPVRWWLLVVPVAWSLVGGSAAFLLSIPQDWMLLVSGSAGVAMFFRKRGATSARAPRSRDSARIGPSHAGP